MSEVVNSPLFWRDMLYFSFCSAHARGDFDPDCSTCLKGSWVTRWDYEADLQLYVGDYAAWYRKHNHVGGIR